MDILLSGVLSYNVLYEKFKFDIVPESEKVAFNWSTNNFN